MTGEASAGLINNLWTEAESREYALKVSRDANQRDFDASMAKELNSLSLQDRERSYEEVHGVAELFDETPEKTAEKIEGLVEALGAISSMPAYDKALELDREYVEDPKFRKMFLRAEDWDTDKAATRLVKYMEKKRKFFGDDSMVRSLTLKDLNKKDLAALKTGTYSILSGRDRSGRCIAFGNSLCGPIPYKDMLDSLRCFIFNSLNAMEDEESQKRGVVSIAWFVGSLRKGESIDQDVMAEMSDVLSWLPQKNAATHICVDPTPLKTVLARAMGALMTPEVRRVTKVHIGSQQEIFYHLMSYGIPVDMIPLDKNGNVKASLQRKYIQRQRMKEHYLMQNPTIKRFPKIELPLPQDVLLGKGKPFQRHAGTANLRAKIEEHLEQYKAASVKDKSAMTWMFVHQVKSNGRFLKKGDDDWWVEVSDEEARLKVGKTFVSQSLASRKKATRTTPNATLHKDDGPALKRSKLEEQVDGKAPGIFGCFSTESHPTVLIWGRSFSPAS